MIKNIPYGRQSIDSNDIKAIADVLCSDWLTTGPKIDEFERVFSASVGARHAVAVSSGTAALHAAVYAAGIKSGDEVIVPAISFVASANCIVFQSGKPIFVDVESDTLLMDAKKVEKAITKRTKAIIAVDYAGQPCDYDILRRIAKRYKLLLIADACHSLGGAYKNQPVGTLADFNVFSFHPVKHITTGEGGMITTENSELAQRMRIFRNHGITADHRQREARGSWQYEMADLGYNYRLTDFQCALGISQLSRLKKWIMQRKEIAKYYDSALAKTEGIMPLKTKASVSHAYHLYVIKLTAGRDRRIIFNALRQLGIGVNVHYLPIYLHPFYRKEFKTRPGLCPMAEEAYNSILSLPMHNNLSKTDLKRIVKTLERVLRTNAK